MQGRVERFQIDSKLLPGHEEVGVRAQRPILAYIPKSVGKSDRVPVLYCLAPWTQAGRATFDWKPFRESLPERIDRLIASGALPPVVVVAPDFYSHVFGGSQFIDSACLGPHARCLVEEVFPFVEAHLPVMPGPKARIVFGRSSGGYGAIRLAVDYPGSVAAIAAHSADMGFELLYGADLISVAKALARYQGNVKTYLEDVLSRPKVSGHDMHVLMLLGMAATYSPTAPKVDGYDVPIDLYSGKLQQETWQRWLEHDPVAMADDRLKRLSQLRGVYLECGVKDQYNLLYGNRQFHGRLNALGLAHRYEEFDDNHSGTDYRYDISLPHLVSSLDL